MVSLATIDMKRGLTRLWMIATVIWFVLIVAVHSHSIFYWIGYHYSLLRSQESISAALREKEQVHNIVEACRAAAIQTCPSPRGQSPTGAPVNYDVLIEDLDAWRKQCTGSQEFLVAFIQEQRKRGVLDASKTLSGAPCTLMADLEIPYIQWPKLIGFVVLPLVPLVFYIVALWIGRGFVKKT